MRRRRARSALKEHLLAEGKKLILAKLRETGGNVGAAARLLSMPPRRLYEAMETYDVALEELDALRPPERRRHT